MNTKTPQTVPFDYYAYIDEIMRLLKIPHDIALEKVTATRELVQDIVDERILQSVLSLFGKKEYEVLIETLDQYPDLDEFDAIMIIADNLPELPQKLTTDLQLLRDEFQHYGSLHEELLNS